MSWTLGKTLIDLNLSLSQLIVGAVAEKFNPVIADVMKAALKVTEQKQKSLGDERSGRHLELFTFAKPGLNSIFVIVESKL